MEYSPGCAIPYISRVDGGTIEAVRQRGVDVCSSGDLVQRFEACWTNAPWRFIASLRAPVSSQGRAFEAVARSVRDGIPTTEFDIQQLMPHGSARKG